MLVATNEVQTVQEYPQLHNNWFLVSLNVLFTGPCLVTFDSSPFPYSNVLPAAVSGRISLPSIPVEPLHIQMHHNQLASGNHYYRYNILCCWSCLGSLCSNS